MQAHLRSTHWIQTPRGRGEWNLNQEMMWPEMDKGLLPQTLGSTEIQRMGGTCFLIIPLSSHTQSTRIMPGHSSTPILHHYQARFLWRISTHVHTYVHTPSFLDTHRQTTTFEKPELFGQKLIDRILLLFVPADSCWSHKRWQGTDFVCEWEHLCARACACMRPHDCVGTCDVAAAVRCGSSLAFLPSSTECSWSYHPCNIQDVCLCCLFVCVCLHISTCVANVIHFML